MMRSIPTGADAGKDSIVPLLPALGAATYPRLIDSLKKGQSGVVDEFEFTVNTMIRGLVQ
jgi:hypothetical protein